MDTGVGAAVTGVTVRVTGLFTVLEGEDMDRPGAPCALGSRKARRLLALLAAHRDQVVSAATAAADLWPEAPPRRPEDNIATLVSRLRGRLGPGIVEGDRAGYRLGRAVQLDLDVAAELCTEARRRLDDGAAGLAVAAAERGVRLAGEGEPLAGEPDAAWLQDLRHRVEALRRALRHLLAEAALAVGDSAAAIDAAGTAARVDPLDDRAHRALMAAYRLAGEPEQALVAYERLRRALARELGTDPHPATRELHLALLRGESPKPTRPAGNGPAGRERETAVLAEAWAGAVAGHAELCLLSGEAGIGKTTLAEETAARAEAAGGLVLRGRCHAAERSLFLQVVVDALGPHLAARAEELRRTAGSAVGPLADLFPDLAPMLDPDRRATDRGLAPDLARRRTYEAVRRVLARLAAARPVLLLLDDLQNAGVATVELVHYLAHRSDGERLLILAKVRAAEGAVCQVTEFVVGREVPVGPLGPDAVSLLAARAGVPRMSEEILRRTRGHTLFVVETLRTVAAGETGVPESLRHAVGARLRQVGDEVERVLRAAAVLGEVVAVETVADVLGAGFPDVVRCCERAARARLLVAAGADYAFANDLVQEIVYATTPGPVRAAHHRRAADLLADRPEVQARHAAAVDDWGRAAPAWLAAGERALERYAAADALLLLDQALGAAARQTEPGLPARVRLARARAHGMLGDFTAAQTDVGHALAAARAAGDRWLELTALRQVTGDAFSALGLPERERRLDAARDLAEELGDRAAEADVCGWQAIVAANRLRFDEAIALGRRAVAAGRAAGVDTALVSGLDGLKTAYAYLGDVGALVPVLAELEPLARRTGDRNVLQWTLFESALPAVAAADWGTATARIESALEVCDRAGLEVHRPWFVAHLGWVRRLRGDLDGALALGREAVSLTAGGGHVWWKATTVALLATTLLARGAPDEAARTARAALVTARAGGTEAYVLRLLAVVAEATGERTAVESADAALAAVRAPAGGAWLAGGDAYLSVARGWLARGEPDRARRALAPLRSAAHRHGWVPWQAAVTTLDADARTGGWDRDYSSSASSSAARAAPPGSTGR